MRMLCRVDERIAFRNLEHIGNELGAVIGLRESKIFACKVSVHCNFFAVDFRVVRRNEQNWHDPQPALQCQRGGDFGHDKGKGKQREQRQVEPESKRKSAPATPGQKKREYFSQHRHDYTSREMPWPFDSDFRLDLNRSESRWLPHGLKSDGQARSSG